MLEVSIETIDIRKDMSMVETDFFLILSLHSEFVDLLKQMIWVRLQITTTFTRFFSIN